MPVVHYPLAILKCTWSDAVWQGDSPVGMQYTDAMINRMFLPLELDWGVAGYWRKATFGLLNLEGSEIFPWRKLQGMPRPAQADTHGGRGPVIQKAVSQGLAEGWPLDQFKGIVVLVGPASPQDAGATSVNQWPACLIQLNDSQYFGAHEVGHVLGFEHTLGPNPNVTPPTLGSYNDVYCVMGDGIFQWPTPPAAGPPATDGYWTGRAPLVSAASLLAFLPGFATETAHVLDGDSLTMNYRRTLRLRARDLERTGLTPYPMAIRVGVPGIGSAGAPLSQVPPAAASAWVVELRRGYGWDTQLGLANWPAAGLVVHSMRPIEEFLGSGDYRQRAVFEGVLPLSQSPSGGPAVIGSGNGDRDARFGGGSLALQVEEVAPDLSWAEITIGGPLLGREAWVSADYGIPVAFAETSREEGVADGVPVFICGKGTYRYLTIRGSQSLMCTATAVGYDAPAFAWKVNGVSVSPPSSPFVVPSVSIPVTSHVPLPSGGETQVPLVATLNHALGVNSLTLTGFAADGNYLLEVEVTASESSATAADPAPPTSDKGSMKMTNVRLVYEDRYYADLEACVSRVKDIDRRFSKSRWPGLKRFLRPEDPAAERMAILERILDDVRFGESPALAEQLSTVVDQVRFRMTLGANCPGIPGSSST